MASTPVYRGSSGSSIVIGDTDAVEIAMPAENPASTEGFWSTLWANVDASYSGNFRGTPWKISKKGKSVQIQVTVQWIRERPFGFFFDI